MPLYSAVIPPCSFSVIFDDDDQFTRLMVMNRAGDFIKEVLKMIQIILAWIIKWLKLLENGSTKVKT